jgi:hypothetical protein
MVVQLDIIVLCRPTVDLPLDLVAIVVDDEEVRLDSVADHGPDLLQRLRGCDVSGVCSVVWVETRRTERALTSWSEPSPTKSTVRRGFCSVAARAHPRAAPTDQPIAPHRI